MSRPISCPGCPSKDVRSFGTHIRRFHADKQQDVWRCFCGHSTTSLDGLAQHSLATSHDVSRAKRTFDQHLLEMAAMFQARLNGDSKASLAHFKVDPGTYANPGVIGRVRPAFEVADDDDDEEDSDDELAGLDDGEEEEERPGPSQAFPFPGQPSQRASLGQAPGSSPKKRRRRVDPKTKTPGLKAARAALPVSERGYAQPGYLRPSGCFRPVRIKCGKCGLELDTTAHHLPNVVLRHVLSQNHGWAREGAYECAVCGDRTRSQNTITRHQKTRHPPQHKGQWRFRQDVDLVWQEILLCFADHLSKATKDPSRVLTMLRHKT